MLGLTLEQTRVYQEAKAEGREEREVEMLKLTVPLLLKTGMSVEQMEVITIALEPCRMTNQLYGFLKTMFYI
ncbi:MAG: hypothetical protein RMY35_007595 [Nostoc sp. DedSLP01]